MLEGINLLRESPEGGGKTCSKRFPGIGFSGALEVVNMTCDVEAQFAVAVLSVSACVGWQWREPQPFQAAVELHTPRLGRVTEPVGWL